MISAALLVATAALASPALASPALASPAVGQDTARTVTRDGVTLPREIDVAGHRLVLNGTALRKKFVVKVYVAALYLPTKQNDAEQILAADQPRQVTLQFLHDVDKGKMCNAWNEALEKNTPNASQELKAQFERLCSYMEDVKKGEGFVFTYLPGTGTEISVRGASKGTIDGKPFADALFKAWIGPKPGPGEGFKKQLLGLS